MIFTSYEFLLFFAVVLLIYYIIPKKFQWIWLLLVSYFFYLQSAPEYVVFLAASTLITYGSGLLVGRINKIKDTYIAEHNLSQDEKEAYMNSCNKKARAICILGVFLNVGILAYTKYINFLGNNIMNIIGGSFTAIDVIIPLGISFYTFQSTGYLIDVYRGTNAPEKNPFRFALYVSFFPQILQGPIAKYGELAPQIYAQHRFEYSRVKSGLLRMLWGFFKKLVIADRAAFFVNTVFDNWKDYGGAIIIIASILYMLQLYADFSGYMDIAIGASEALGITLCENFNTPFLSQSVPEFWRRWHISLGRWFKEYIYIPLGGNRKGMLRTIFNLSVVWIVTGIWHGSSWNFVVWGVYFGVLIVFSKLFSPLILVLENKARLKTDRFSFRFFKIVKTDLLVIFGFIFFRANGLKNAFGMIGKMFTIYNPWVFTDGTMLKLGIDGKDWNVLIASVIVLICVSLANEKGIKVREKIMEQGTVFQWLIYFVGIFAVLIFGCYGPGYEASSFIYLNF